jgi:8-oxo-dGTP diphosphatase
MTKAARAIVISDGKLLVMKRDKFGEKYYTLVGGRVDQRETGEQAAIREVKEETGLDAINLRLVFIEESQGQFGPQYIYMCDVATVSEPHLEDTSVEAMLNKQGVNLSEPMWVSTEDFAGLPFVSKQLQEAILDGLRNGFPARPKTLHSGQGSALY